MPSRSVHAVVGEHEDDHRVPLSLHGSQDDATAAADAYRNRERAPVAPYESVAGGPSEYLFERFDAYTVETWDVEADSAWTPTLGAPSAVGEGGRFLRRTPALVAGLVGVGAVATAVDRVTIESLLALPPSTLALLVYLLAGLVVATYVVAFVATTGLRRAASRTQRVPVTQRSE
ncbi:hypothetical protein ACFO0N_09155 [Halobium salinum]|uniref:Uncharacterized protein n=1 Tax=Halobium salinum TaxID=1364940 RepID=A0ABD5PCB5_9EURY|nr:hypothetical protein [Halobium salinum]